MGAQGGAAASAPPQGCLVNTQITWESVSWGCCHTVPPTEWLQTTEINSLTLLEAGV